MQNIPTNEASGLNFFEILSGQFLTVANTRSTKSVIYKWKGNGFEMFQEIETEKAKACTAFVINNDNAFQTKIWRYDLDKFGAKLIVHTEKIVTPRENSKLDGKKLVFRQDQAKQDIKFTVSVNICEFIHCSSFF